MDKTMTMMAHTHWAAGQNRNETIKKLEERSEDEEHVDAEGGEVLVECVCVLIGDRMAGAHGALNEIKRSANRNEEKRKSIKVI